ncbi:MAG: hypothetical protein Q8Q25_01285, partial [bacterium]|nr:hypothetical protein [bacterium]
ALLRNQIRIIIEKINTNISYWYDQKDHTAARYYLQRAPRYWLSKKAAKNEVEDNIAQLEGLRDDYFKAFYQITQCCNDYDERATVPQQELWLNQVINACMGVPYIQNALPIEVGLDYVTRMKTILAILPHYDRLIAQDLGDARMPGHFVRNWLGYVAASLATYYIYRKSDIIADRASDIGKNLYEQNIDPLYKKFRHAFGGKPQSVEAHPEMSRKDAYAKAETDFKKGLDTMTQAIPASSPDRTTLSKDELVKQYIDAVSVVRKAGYTLPDFDLETAAQNLDMSLLEKLLHHGTTRILPKTYQVKKLQVASDFVPLAIVYASVQKYEVEQAFKRLVDGYKTGSEDIKNGFALFAEQVTKDATDGFDTVNRVMEQNELTLAATAVLPVLGIGYGALRGLKWFGYKLMPKSLLLPYNYAPTREAIRELHRVASCPENKRTQVEQGKWFFYLEKLKRDARQYLHGQGQRDFMDDVSALETTPDKLAVINRMWKTYKFLDANYTV